MAPVDTLHQWAFVHYSSRTICVAS